LGVCFQSFAYENLVFLHHLMQRQFPHCTFWTFLLRSSWLYVNGFIFELFSVPLVNMSMSSAILF
jgi:hypothetical protein